ncbi:serine/threonine-protein kinase [Actinophytocola sp.]|uniref:serine/threonine-protein kinase n=1 Tax=Actinophytocola sp. TaxID=1872138 RepID=UPI003D6C046B
MVALDLTGRTLAGYRVGTLLGHGAYGWVFQAHQLSLDRPVALKVLDPAVARNPDAARRFDREGRSAAALDHPAIVDVYHAGESDGFHFLAMRIIDGVALDRMLARGPLSTPELLALLHRIGPALDHAHARGVIHRDVKPANILLEQGDPGRAWLGDFGIAVSVRLPGATTTATIGTPHYMAPEQAGAGRVGPAADQYSLACVAYQAITGRCPFAGDDMFAVLLAHQAEPPPPTGSPALDAVLGKAMAKQPDARYRTVTEFVAALDAALRPARSTVRLAGAPPRRARGRGRWVAGVGAVALVAAGGVTAAVFLPDGTQPTGGEAPPGWVAVDGPGSVRYTVPPDWDKADAGPVYRFTASGQQRLTVGSETPVAADPKADLTRLFSCADEPREHTVPAGTAASCTADGTRMTVVVAEATAVRFVFTDQVSPADSDTILTSLTFG